MTPLTAALLLASSLLPGAFALSGPVDPRPPFLWDARGCADIRSLQPSAVFIMGGSGFVGAAGGVVVTNKHVVANWPPGVEARIQLCTRDEALAGVRRLKRAQVLLIDPASDIAVVRVLDPLPGAMPVVYANALPAPGEPGALVSHPLRAPYDLAPLVFGESRVVGRLSNGRGGAMERFSLAYRNEAGDIHEGSSGSAVYDCRGRVVGIHSHTGPEGYAAPLERILDALRAAGVELTPVASDPILAGI
jgi:S1-C subfamily serine protease